MARWGRRTSSRADWSLKGHLTSTDVEVMRSKTRSQVGGAEFQQSVGIGRHDLTWNAEYRVTANEGFSNAILTFTPRRHVGRTVSVFVQDDIVLRARALTLTVGSKFEDSDRTTFDVTPTVRLAWTPRPDLSLWSGVSEATRIPARYRRDVTVEVAAIPT